MKGLLAKTAKSKDDELMNQIIIRFAGLISSAKYQGIENFAFADLDMDDLTDPDVFHDAATAMYLASSFATLEHGEELCIELWGRTRVLVDEHWQQILEKVTM